MTKTKKRDARLKQGEVNLTAALRWCVLSAVSNLSKFPELDQKQVDRLSRPNSPSLERVRIYSAYLLSRSALKILLMAQGHLEE